MRNTMPILHLETLTSVTLALCKAGFCEDTPAHRFKSVPTSQDQTQQRMTSNVTKLHSSVKGFPARGGASLVEVNGKVLIFGGADREATHFQDLTVYNSCVDSYFTTVKTTGDVPMPRSGHAVVGYGKYMFLFGGIDFKEEAVFNDLYILNTDTFEWGYVGESGVEVIARNSHSLAVLSDHAHDRAHPAKHYLVVYGGASPEHGPLQDTVYAELPEADAIDTVSIYVEWKLLPTTITTTAPSTAEPNVFTKTTTTASTTTTTLPHPAAREMHGTCTYAGNMYITGGRSESGAILSDVWMLSASSVGSASSVSSVSCVGDVSVADNKLPVTNTKVSDSKTNDSTKSSDSSDSNGISKSNNISKSNSELSLASGEENWDKTPPESPTTPNPHNTPAYDNTTGADKKAKSGSNVVDTNSSSGVKKGSSAGKGDTKSGVKSNVTIVDITPANAGTTTATATTPPASTATTTTTSADTSGVCFKWTRLTHLELPSPRCAHGAAVSAMGNTHFALHHPQGSGDKEVHRSGEVSTDAAIHSVESSVSIVLFGGLTTSGVSGDVITAPLHTTATGASMWRTNTLSTPITARFGLSLCALSVHTLSHIASNRRYHPFVSPATTACIDNKKVLLHKKSNNHISVAYNHGGVLLFGGVSIDCDFCDVYLIAL